MTTGVRKALHGVTKIPCAGLFKRFLPEAAGRLPGAKTIATLRRQDVLSVFSIDFFPYFVSKPCLLRLFYLIFLLLLTNALSAQYYLRGEIRDENGKKLTNVRFVLKSKGSYPYSSGSTGIFGIPSSVRIDTIIVDHEGYEPFRMPVNTTTYQYITLKSLPSTASLVRRQLASKTTDLFKDRNQLHFSIGESYNPTIENSFVDGAKYPETGFALNIDRASYSNIRRFLNMEYTVPPDAVRIEEILNYFNFSPIVKADGNKRFAFESKIATTPWNPNNQLLYLKMEAPTVDVSNVPPSNFVFLIDISGSMDKENRLPLVKSAFKLLVQHLRPVDTVSIVVYGGQIGVLLYPTSGGEKEKIVQAIEQLNASGDTPGEAAIKLAYNLARRSMNPAANNRIILATDGDFNVGQTTEKELEEMIVQHRQTGIYLTCLGVGMGNYKDSKLEILAKKGNGNFAYLDNLKEAEKVLVTEFTKTAFSVANDAYINVRFNPEFVKQYRLIGFDNKEDAITDTSSVLEGGDIGSGHHIVALFEVVPTAKAKDTSVFCAAADVRLHYRLPGNDNSIFESWRVENKPSDFKSAGHDMKLATALCMFGQLVKQSDYARGYNWEDVLYLVNHLSKPDDYLLLELNELVLKAKKIYTNNRRRKDKPLIFSVNPL